jgi:hypothetical protein
MSDRFDSLRDHEHVVRATNKQADMDAIFDRLASETDAWKERCLAAEAEVKRLLIGPEDTLLTPREAAQVLGFIPSPPRAADSWLAIRAKLKHRARSDNLAMPREHGAQDPDWHPGLPIRREP